MTEFKALTVSWGQNESQGICLVTINQQQEAVNSLNESLGEDFRRLLDHLEDLLEQGNAIKGLLLISGKADNFIAGADLKMLKEVKVASQGRALSELAQELHSKMELLPFPTVAAINGACLGGGLELALALDYRIGTDSQETVFGFPEVQLGLIPAGGGTQRSPNLIGAVATLDLMLTGKRLNAKRAFKQGLIDEVCPKEELLARANFAVSKVGKRDISKLPLNSWFNKKGFVENLLMRNALARKIFVGQVKKRTFKQTKGHYTAPEKIIEAILTGYEDGTDAGYRAEAKAFGELTTDPVARELINLFFASTELKKDSGVDKKDVPAMELNTIGIVGSGLMGSGIAYVSALYAGNEVVMKDRDIVGARRGQQTIKSQLDKRVARNRMSQARMNNVIKRISITEDYSELTTCELIVEAVFEDVSVKHEVLSAVEQEFGEQPFIFASNTSSIPINEIAQASQHPERVIGMHYFSPVEKMPLLEIVVTDKTFDEVIVTCVALGKAQKKVVIVVKDGPGFYTSRILTPYLNEAGWLLEEGVTIDELDQALFQFGFPVGPLTLIDEVGLDVGAKVSEILLRNLGARFTSPKSLKTLKEKKRFGRKSKAGFYRYDRDYKGKRPIDSKTYKLIKHSSEGKNVPSEIIVERCVLQMLNEAARCLDESILRSARDGDIGAVFGLGFPPFLGGPFRYMDKIGLATLVERLSHFEQQYGNRFKPAPILERMKRDRISFYD